MQWLISIARFQLIWSVLRSFIHISSNYQNSLNGNKWYIILFSLKFSFWSRVIHSTLSSLEGVIFFVQFTSKISLEIIIYVITARRHFVLENIHNIKIIKMYTSIIIRYFRRIQTFEDAIFFVDNRF